MSKALPLAFLALSVSLSACEKNRTAPPAQVNESLVAAASAPAQVARPPERASDAADAATAPELTPEAWLDLVLDAQLLSQSPDETAARFAQAGKLERLSVTPESLELRAETARHALQIMYAKSETWAFQGLVLELVPSESETVETLYKALDEPIKAKLGKPIAVHKAAGSPPQKIYKLSKTHVAILNERPSGDRRVVYVEIAEPQQSD